MFSLAICKVHQIIGLSEHLHADAFPFPFVLAPSLLVEVLKGRPGSRERAKGFFCQAVSFWPCTLPSGAGGGVWQCSRAGAGRAAAWCKCGVAVLQLLATEQSCKPCSSTAHVKRFGVWQITGEGANICLTSSVLLIGVLATKPTSFRFPC